MAAYRCACCTPDFGNTCSESCLAQPPRINLADNEVEHCTDRAKKRAVHVGA